MAWLRVDDSECLDPDVGELTDAEYRARHGLLQYCARKHRDDGVFHAREIVYAIHATPRGPRSVTRQQLARFLALGLVRTLESYTEEELTNLTLHFVKGSEDDKTSLLEVAYKGTGWLRPNNWERFNPPRDNTVAERQRRYRSRKGNTVSHAVTHGVTHGDVTAPRAQARVRVPVPSRKKEPKAVTSTDFAGAEPDDTNGPGLHDIQELEATTAARLRSI